jgi:dihydrodipicolinate reductase
VTAPIPVVVAGAGGRMGDLVTRAVLADRRFMLADSSPRRRSALGDSRHGGRLEPIQRVLARRR